MIEWGRRRYLIPPAEMRGFREAIVEGREPRDDAHGHYYLRLPIAPADGLPNSTTDWADGLRKDFLLGKILAVSTVGLAKVGRATVDLGAREGLREGDLLTVQRPGPQWVRRLRVVSVADHSCVADECPPSATEPEVEMEPGQAVVAVKIGERDGRR